MSAPSLKLTGRVSSLCKRNLGIFAPALQKASDPIQQLFLQKLRDYKSKSAGGKLVEPSPEAEKQLKGDREKTLRQFNVKSADELTKFPSFTFKEPTYEKPYLEDIK